MRIAAFGATFLAAWLALDRLASSPPTVLSALAALAVAAAVLVAGQRFLLREPVRLGLGRPTTRGCVLAAVAGLAVAGCYLGGAAVLGVHLELRPNWYLVLLAVLIFHGLAEELVWRGFAFAHLRQSTSFRRAVLWSMPLIALTHVPLLITSGWTVGLLGLTSAAVTCVPLAWLWEHGGRTIWPPAILHGLIGTWQLWDRTYPPTFSLVVLLASILVPLAVPAVPALRPRSALHRNSRPVSEMQRPALPPMS